ncbi:pyridoxamine 5'-phosphate oxidase family protein (plasmid) [Tistrella mobilis]|uniref:HugZ family pyridoxamine 5'-phosphate oxidase n=1 Tax=Tistrella mobilis TaxID=171437 RepID=UPI003556BF7A
MTTPAPSVDTPPTNGAPVITPRGRELRLDAALPFDAEDHGRRLLRTARFGTLSTLDPESGYPYGAATNLATDHDGSPVFIMAGLALHARNLAADPRASLTLVEPGLTDVLAGVRMTIVGRVVQVTDPARLEAVRWRYLARHPKTKLYMTLPDIGLYRLEMADLRVAGGPRRNAGEPQVAHFLTDLTGAEALLTAEAEEVERLNGPWGEDLPGRLARLHGGGDAGRWRAAGIDPEGIDLTSPDGDLRIRFPRRVTDPQAMRSALAALVRPVMVTGGK